MNNLFNVFISTILTIAVGFGTSGHADLNPKAPIDDTNSSGETIRLVKELNDLPFGDVARILDLQARSPEEKAAVADLRRTAMQFGKDDGTLKFGAVAGRDLKSTSVIFAICAGLILVVVLGMKADIARAGRPPSQCDTKQTKKIVQLIKDSKNGVATANLRESSAAQ